MGFLAGSASYDCFRINDADTRQFGSKHIEKLEQFAIQAKGNLAADQSRAGLLAGEHLFDLDFDLEKNIINDVMHFAMRIDTNQIPAAVRKAWLQMELAVFRAESPDRRPTKAEREEAKEAVEARCDDAARTGQYLKMQQFPILWDSASATLYFGGSSPKASDVCKELLEKAFELDLTLLSSSQLADEWATQAKRRRALSEAVPASFRKTPGGTSIQWWNGQADNYDFLGNEFLIWLWWKWETDSDTIALNDGSEVTGMFARTLSVQCPLGETGKGTISAESPTSLPEAVQAIRTGKLPRRAGLTLVRQGQQYDLALQAETFAVSGAKIRIEEKVDGRAAAEERIEGLRGLSETIELLYQRFLDVRIGKQWPQELRKIRKWLTPRPPQRKADPEE